VEIEAPPDPWPGPEQDDGDGADEDALSLLEMPMTLLLHEVQADWQKLGKDAGGNPTIVEQEKLLDRHGIEDPDERELRCDLWDAITGAKEEAMAERFGKKPGQES
jgi:hypothetical protein